MAAPRPTPYLAWSLVHEQDVPMRTAADRLGVPVSELLTLLATYCPPPALAKKSAPLPRPAAPPPAPPPSHPAGRKRVDVVRAWRAAEAGSTAAQIAAAMGFSTDGVHQALQREAVRRRCLPPTATAPVPPTRAEQAWSLVHGDGLDVRTAARRMRLRPPAVFELLAQHAPTVRGREWLELALAGEAPDGRADWIAQRHAHLVSRVRALPGQGLSQAIISERFGLTMSQAADLMAEARSTNGGRAGGVPSSP